MIKGDSAKGNGNVLSEIQKLNTGDILAIVDGAAFGAMIENCLEYLALQDRQRISVWMLESFEYLILKSGLIEEKNLGDILEFPSNYIESEKYESWENFFTQLLISLTEAKPYKYSKTLLNEYYLQDRNIRKILENFPKAVKYNLENRRNIPID